MSRTGWNCWSTPTGTILRKLRRLLLRTFRTDSWPPRLLFVATQRPNRLSPAVMGRLSQKNFTKIGEAADAQYFAIGQDVSKTALIRKSNVVL